MNNYQKIELKNSLYLSCMKTYFLILIPSTMLSFMLAMVVNMNIFPSDKLLAQKNDIDIFSALVVAPVLENLVMSFLIKLLSEKIDSKIKISFIIGVIASAIHGIQNFTSLFSAGWSFYMLSIFFMETENKYGYWKAFKTSSLIHFLINLTAIGILKLGTEISGAR